MHDPLLYVLTPSAEPHGLAYGTFEAAASIVELSSWLAPGSIVALRPHPATSWSDLANRIEMVQRRLFNAPLALWPDCVGHERAVEFAGKARQFGVRCVVWHSAPDRERIRRQLADPADWSRMVVVWVRHRYAEVPPAVERLLEDLAEDAFARARVGRFAARDGLQMRRWNRSLRTSGLAPVGTWYSALRVTRIGIEIQRYPESSIESIALRVGYSALSALSRRFDEQLGAPPTFIRQRLGWQWMFASALRRSGVDLTARGQKRPRKE